MAVNRLDMETQAVFSTVQNLYGMTFTSRGRDAVVAVVTMGDSIIALTKHTSEDGKKDMKKSAVRGFASEILLMVIRSSDNVEFMKKYCTQLLTIGSSDSHSKLCQAQGGEIRGARETTTNKNGEYSLQRACDFCEVIAAPSVSLGRPGSRTKD